MPALSANPNWGFNKTEVIDLLARLASMSEKVGKIISPTEWPQILQRKNVTPEAVQQHLGLSSVEELKTYQDTEVAYPITMQNGRKLFLVLTIVSSWGGMWGGQKIYVPKLIGIIGANETKSKAYRFFYKNGQSGLEIKDQHGGQAWLVKRNGESIHDDFSTTSLSKQSEKLHFSYTDEDTFSGKAFVEWEAKKIEFEFRSQQELHEIQEVLNWICDELFSSNVAGKIRSDLLDLFD